VGVALISIAQNYSVSLRLATGLLEAMLALVPLLFVNLPIEIPSWTFVELWGEGGMLNYTLIQLFLFQVKNAGV